MNSNIREREDSYERIQNFFKHILNNKKDLFTSSSKGEDFENQLMAYLEKKWIL